MHWEPGSSIANLVATLGKRLDESEKDMVSIMRTHWVDTSNGVDLDRHGALYSIKRKEGEMDTDYRNRLKTAIISYKGGGTVGAIKMLIRITLKLPQDFPVQIAENPPVTLKKTWKVSAGREWMVNPRNINETVPDVTITVDTENARIKDPTITNLTTDESVTFRGDISHGDALSISKGRAMLNGKDLTDRLSTTSVPGLPREKSKWRYTEYVGANMGIFDRTHFDDSVYVIDIISTVTFEWTAYQPATFDLVLQKEMLNKAGVTESFMQDILNSVKACGVKAVVKMD
jgi:hypothetical protein